MSEERLRAIELQLVELNERLKPLSDLVKVHQYIIFGNGNPGLKGNVQSLLEHKENIRWHTGAAWTAFLGLIAKIVYDQVTR